MGNAAEIVHAINRLAKWLSESIGRGWLVLALTLAVMEVAGAQNIPTAPDVAKIEKFCKIAPGSLSLNLTTPETEPKLKGRMFWMAAYTPKDQRKLPLGLGISLVEQGKFNPLSEMASRPGVQKQTLKNGDEIYQIPGTPSDPWYVYNTFLHRKGKPYSVMLFIARPHQVPDSQIPVDIKTAGIQLIQELFEPGTP